ncbi:MAG: DUF899 family protein [Emcibacteraceae bacterium]
MEHKIVCKQEWIKYRKELMIKEKELKKLSDHVSQARRDMPWVEVEKNYTFHGPEGDITFGELFKGKKQLIVQHFMYGADWDEGCPRCSAIADCHNGINIHLNQRDINMVVISNGPLENLLNYKKRMGWSFDWYSCLGTDFGYDFDVSFTKEAYDNGTATYNYSPLKNPVDELSGVSVFIKGDDGKIYHTYSAFFDSLEPLLTFYRYMDITPIGRNENPDKVFMSWIKRHDEYESSARK